MLIGLIALEGGEGGSAKIVFCPTMTGTDIPKGLMEKKIFEGAKLPNEVVTPAPDNMVVGEYNWLLKNKGEF